MFEWRCEKRPSLVTAMTKPNKLLSRLGCFISLTIAWYALCSCQNLMCSDNIQSDSPPPPLPPPLPSLIVGPLSGVSWDGPPMVILIDALDEAGTGAASNGLLHLVKGPLAELPSWVRCGGVGWGGVACRGCE